MPPTQSVERFKDAHMNSQRSMCDGQKSTYAEDANGSLSARAMGHMAATRQARGYGNFVGEDLEEGRS